MLAQREHCKRRGLPFQDSPFHSLLGGLDNTFGYTGPDTPLIQVDETDTGFNIRTELPGVAEKDVVIQVQDHRVSVAIPARKDQQAEEKTAHRFEGFQRAFRFRTALQSDAAEARLEKGILTIHLPKAASAVPRTLTLTPAT